MSDVLVLHRDHPIARKEHTCSCCGRTIRTGEPYERQDNVYDGQRYTYKCCEHCDMATTRALELFDPWDEGIDWDWIENTLCDYHETVSDLRMLVLLRRRWTRRDGTLFPVPTHPMDSETT